VLLGGLGVDVFFSSLFLSLSLSVSQEVWFNLCIALGWERMGWDGTGCDGMVWDGRDISDDFPFVMFSYAR
jgi:hypothetical protein